MGTPDSNGSKTNGNPEMKWLVKSDDKIFGPFSAEQVRNKLMARELTIFDEVMKPFGRWKHLRVEEEFAEAVEAMRTDLMNSREDTEVATAITQTEFLGEGSREVTGQTSDVDYKRRRYGVASEASNVGTREAKMLWYLFIGLIVSTVLIYFALNSRLFGWGEGRRHYQDLIARAQEALFVGDSFLALRVLSQADEVRAGAGMALDANAALQLAALKMKFNGEVVAAKRLANEVLKSGPPTLTQAMAKNVLAMAAVRNDEIKEAKLLIDESGLSTPEIAFNRAVIDMLNNDYDSAVSVLRNVLKVKPDFDEARYLLARSLLKLDAAGQQGKFESYEMLKALRSERGVYTFDAAIALALIDIQHGDRPTAAATVKAAFDEDPLVLDDQITSVFLMRQFVSPSALVEDCKSIHKALNNYISQALVALCQARAGDPGAAQASLSGVLAGKPQDPILQSISALILFASAREDEARTTLKLIRGKNEFPTLGQMLTIRDCAIRNDGECEQKASEALSKLTPVPLIALASQIRILHRQGKQNEARALYKQLKDRTAQLKQVHQLSRIVENK